MKRKELKTKEKTNVTLKLDRDLLREVRIRQALVKRLHTRLPSARLHGGINLMDFIFADQVTNGRSRNQDFHDHNAAAAVRTRQKRLAKNAFDYHG